jgi:hypothetical protein
VHGARSRLDRERVNALGIHRVQLELRRHEAHRVTAHGIDG